MLLYMMKASSLVALSCQESVMELDELTKEFNRDGPEGASRFCINTPAGSEYQDSLVEGVLSSETVMK